MNYGVLEKMECKVHLCGKLSFVNYQFDLLGLCVQIE